MKFKFKPSELLPVISAHGYKWMNGKLAALRLWTCFIQPVLSCLWGECIYKMSQGAVSPFDSPSGEQRLGTNAARINRLLFYWARCQDALAFKAAAPDAGHEGLPSKPNAKWVIPHRLILSPPLIQPPLVNYLLFCFTHLSPCQQSKN